jgi:uncharacterized protein (DUF427 family)
MTRPAKVSERDYPQMAAETGRIEPAPRRVRATLGGRTVFDTTRARYVWEFPFYPQYYIPLADVDARLLADEGHEQHLERGTARRHGLAAPHAGMGCTPVVRSVPAASACSGPTL